MIDMVGVNAELASGGKRTVAARGAGNPQFAGRGHLHASTRDGPKPDQIVPADKVAEMNNIMTHVVTEGTGRGAQIPGLVISGKTGTTNNSTNAWFNAFTGNLVGSVWFGNDDGAPMGDMTGGTLPALSWRDIMTYAHRDLEPKPPFGVAAPATPAAVAAAGAKGQEAKEPAPRAATLGAEGGARSAGDRRIRPRRPRRAALAPGRTTRGWKRPRRPRAPTF